MAMNLCNLFATLFLVILLDGTNVTCSPVDLSPYSAYNSSDEGSSGDCDTTFTVSNAGGKPPILGSPTRIVSPYGFIEKTCQDGVSFGEDSPPSNINYWRITCPTYKQKMMVVIMGLHISSTNYLQVKHLKMTGVVEKKFHSYSFNKRSILVALVGGKHLFSYQSSFLLGYVCVDDNSKKLAEELLLDSPRVLEYMRCRPHTFKMVTKLILDPSKLLNFHSNKDMNNILHLKNNSNAVLNDMPPCTDNEVDSSGTSGSAP